MKKILIILALALLVFCVCCPKPSHAELVVGGAGQYYLPGGDIDNNGGGWTAQFGNQVGDHWIMWGRRIEYIADGSHVVGGDGGVSLLSDQFIQPLRMGIYANLGVGAGQVNTDPISFSVLNGIGVYSQISPIVKITGGIQWINTGKFNTSAIQMGVTFNLIPATEIAKMRMKEK